MLTAFLHAIYAADKKQGGCTVEFTPITVPTQSISCYGVVTWGYNESARIFHTEEELFEILTRLAKD